MTALGWRKRGGGKRGVGRKKMIDKETHEVAAMKLALDALNDAVLDYSMGKGAVIRHTDAIKALEEALAKQEQRSVSEHTGEPVAWMRKDEVKAMTDVEKQAWTASQQGVDGYWSEVVKDYSIPLYTTPQQRKPLSAYINSAKINATDLPHIVVEKLEKAIEAAHDITQEKNT